MKKLIQNRLHKAPDMMNAPPEQRGNCYPTVIACFLDLDSPEDVIQIQEHYNEHDWPLTLHNWLRERGWEFGGLDGHQYDDSYYLVMGHTKRSDVVGHVCIYKNGKLYHDPHPDQSGLTTEDYFEYLDKIE